MAYWICHFLSIVNLSVAKVGRILYNYFINNREVDLANTNDKYPTIRTATENIDGTYSLFIDSQTHNGVFEERYQKDDLSAIVNKLYKFLNDD